MDREIVLAYSRAAVRLNVPDEKLVGVFEPLAIAPAADAAAAVRAALASPIGASRLRERAAGARDVVITIEDATRPSPNALLLDAVMEELTAAGVAPERITVLVATGLHRDLTPQEMAASLGRWHGKLRAENHAARDASRLVKLGRTKLGTEISINRRFMEADLKILTGDVEYHQFVGYGGGAKSIYPGLADAAAIETNHSRMDLPGTGSGRIDGNPVREEIEEVGRMARADYLLCVALDGQHRVVSAHAGDVGQTFRAGAQMVDRMYRVNVPRRAELVIASPGGHPKDLDLYQSQKAIEEATRIVKLGGDVLTVAECGEGTGSALFEEWMDAAIAPDDIIVRIKEKFTMGGHKAYQIAREVQRANIYLYSQLPPGRVRAWFMRPVRDLAAAQELIARAKTISVLPQATLTNTVLAE